MHPKPAVSLGWRLRHSWWLLLPILGFSCVGGAGFLYVGLRARRPAWWISGIGYLVLSWGAFIMVGGGESRSTQSSWGAGVFMMVWIASIMHACLINSSWLRWRAGHQPWYAKPAPTWPAASYPPGSLAAPPHLPAMAPMPTPGPTSAAGHRRTFDRPDESPAPGLMAAASPMDAYRAPGPAATFVPPQPAPASPPQASASPSSPTSPSSSPSSSARQFVAQSLDINAVGTEQLAALPGFDPLRARHVLTEREARRGFSSVAEFAAVAGLAPHEYARLRHLLVCTPPAGPAPDPGQFPTGRVLDV